MNILISLCMVLAIMLSGCGKCKKDKYHHDKHHHEKKHHHDHDKHTMQSAQLDDTVSDDAEFSLAESELDGPSVEFDEEFFDQTSQEIAMLEEELDQVQSGLDDQEENDAFAFADFDDQEMVEEQYAVADNAEEYTEQDYEQEPAHYAFKTINFPINGESISAEQAEILNQDIEVAREAIEQGKKVVVQGHSCQLGSPSYNMALSIKRARAVKDAMVKAGLEEEKIEVVGFGNELPVVWSDAKNREDRIKDLSPNRRTEIIIS